MPPPVKTGRFLFDFAAGSDPDQDLFLQLFTAYDISGINTPPHFGFVEASFPGYTKFSHDLWPVREITDQGSVLVQSKRVTWLARLDSSSPDVLGYFLIGTIPLQRTLIGWELFDKPQRVSHAGDTITLEVQARDYLYTLT